MTTLKEFEEALEKAGMVDALVILSALRQRHREERSTAPMRRVTGRKMTAQLAHEILTLHQTTRMTQQEIAFRLGVNQGRVNEVIKHGKWLSDDPSSPEAVARDRALERARRGTARAPRPAPVAAAPAETAERRPARRDRRGASGQLILGI